MNLLQLVLKQMRQRALSTWLTLLSILLGVALAVAIMILRREAASLFGQSEFGYEVLVGVKGSPLQLVLNTIYNLDVSPGSIRWPAYEELLNDSRYRGDIRFAFPLCVGDSYKGRRIIGAEPRMFGFGDDGAPLEGYDKSGRLLSGYDDPNKPLRQRDETRPLAAGALAYRQGEKYTLAQGRMFHARKFEAVVGADIAKLTGLKLGDSFQPTHGQPAANQRADVHEEKWTVVGVLNRTNTAADGAIYIPLTSFFTIFEHGEAELDREWLRKGWNPATRPHKEEAHETHDGHEGHDHDKHYALAADGTIDLHIPREALEVSAVLVKTRTDFSADNLIYNVRLRDDLMAVNPASTMRDFFNTFFAGSSIVLLIVALLVTLVAAVGILVSIYNAISARLREIAILRALGATRYRILALICLEAAIIGLVGGLLGVLCGHLLAGAGSLFARSLLGQGINWMAMDRVEWLYVLATTVLAGLAGLVPALKAYRTPVATNLVAV